MLILKDFQENIAINFATDTFKQKSNKLIKTALIPIFTDTHTHKE